MQDLLTLAYVCDAWRMGLEGTGRSWESSRDTTYGGYVPSPEVEDPDSDITAPGGYICFSDADLDDELPEADVDGYTVEVEDDSEYTKSLEPSNLPAATCDATAESGPLPDWGKEIIGEAVQSIAWEGFKIAALHATPLGPVVVAGCYLARQAIYAVLGVASGNGFVVEVSIPQLSFLPGISSIPDQFEVTVRARVLGRQTGPISEISIKPEFQIYHQWLEEVDISRAEAEERTTGVPPATDAAAESRPDSWDQWLSLYGRTLIQNLARALAKRSGGLPPIP